MLADTHGISYDPYRFTTPFHAASSSSSRCIQPCERVKLYVDGAAPLDVLSNLEQSMDITNSIKIGAGSFSDVLVMKEWEGDSWIAVKAISMSKARARLGPSAESRLRHEVRVMRELDHPNLVKLLDVMVCRQPLAEVEHEPPYFCICMEYVSESEPLSHVIRRVGAQANLLLEVTPQLASALALMHSRGLVHRDVWSENVLVGKDGHVVLVDLGCAENFQDESVACTKLNVPYMSPEAALGERQQPGDDCWCLGLLMCEMATGRFVADRIGNCSTPIHHHPEVLAEAIRETAAVAGNSIGRICQELLTLDGSPRLPMVDVGTRLAAIRNAASSRTPCQFAQAPGCTPCRTPRTSSRPAEVTSPTLNGPCRTPPAPGGGQLPAWPQSLAARSPVAPYLAQGRAGSVAVPMASTDSEHAGWSALRSPSSFEEVKAGPPRRPAVRRPLEPQKAAPLAWLSQVATPMSHWSSSPTPPTSGAPQVAPAFVQTPSVSGTSTPAMAGPAPSRSSGNKTQVQVGHIVAYLARSNNMWYTGQVVGRAGVSWQVKLDCGYLKEVDDADAWRLVTLPSQAP